MTQAKDLAVPTVTGSDRLRGRNNWDLVRLILATMVVAYHSYVMTGLPAPDWYTTIARGDLAVAGFFGLSGYMVAGSYARSGDLPTYFLARFCRIYPAYAASIIFALAVGLSVSTSASTMQLVSASGRYLIANLTFLNNVQGTLPGAFEDHLHPEINTAWWTLKIEVAFYFALPIFFLLLRRRHGLLWAAGLYALGYGWSAGFNLFADPAQSNFYARMARQLPGWTGYFVVGVAAYHHRDVLDRYRWPIAGVAAAIVLSGVHQFDIAAPLAITLLVLSAGLIGHHVPINRFGDISFGIYVYHSPIIQLLIWAGFAQRAGLLLTFGMTMLALVPLAWLSWTLIEHPALRWAKLRRTQVAATAR